MMLMFTILLLACIAPARQPMDVGVKVPLLTPQHSGRFKRRWPRG